MLKRSLSTDTLRKLAVLSHIRNTEHCQAQDATLYQRAKILADKGKASCSLCAKRNQETSFCSHKKKKVNPLSFDRCFKAKTKAKAGEL